MGGFVLKKGAVVGHGTSLSRLPGILADGIRRGMERDADRSQIELAPESTGIYVGELMAYFGAYAQYSAEVAPHLEDPRIMAAAFCLAQDEAVRMKSMDLPDAPLTFPVVIKIRLQEDCELWADEDFVADGKYPVDEKVPETMLQAEAELVWNRWRSGVLLRDIPPTWFEAIEHPRVGNLDGQAKVTKQVFTDCELFAGSVIQSYKKMDPRGLITDFISANGKLALSQSMPPTAAALEKLVGFTGFANSANRFYNHLTLFHLMDVHAHRYKIPMVRSLGERLVLDRNGDQ
jgi:hypothetical protein